MLVKIHESKMNKVVAICDNDLIGKEFDEGELYLKISESFYNGESKTIEEVEEIMINEDNLNLVGEKTIKIALNLKLINEKNIIKVQGVPHAQIIKAY